MLTGETQSHLSGECQCINRADRPTTHTYSSTVYSICHNASERGRASRRHYDFYVAKSREKKTLQTYDRRNKTDGFESLMNEWGGRQVSDGSALGWGMSALGTLEPTPFSILPILSSLCIQNIFACILGFFLIPIDRENAISRSILYNMVPRDVRDGYIPLSNLVFGPHGSPSPIYPAKYIWYSP